MVEIESIIVDDDDLHAELAMIDENLCRAELSPADRARQTARRFEIHKEIHGSPKAKGAHAAHEAMGHAHDANAKFADAFTTETAKLTGASERAVQLDVQRGQAIIPSVLKLITGTELDKGSYLDEIRKVRSADQMTKARRDLAVGAFLGDTRSDR